MALTPTQEAIKKAIENQNKVYRDGGDKDAMAKAAKDTAAAESANNAAYTSKSSSSNNSSSKSGGGSKSSTPTLAAAVDPAKQKADQDYINSTVKGGLASYAKTQQERYNTADPTLRAALEADAKRVGITLSGSSTASAQQIDNRSAREKYATGTPYTAEQEAELTQYEKDLKEKGYAKLPSFMQDASGKYQDDLMAANRNQFYQDNSKNWNDAQKNYYAAQEAQIAKNGGSVSRAIMNNDYMGTERTAPTGQSGKFDWQTGQFSGDPRMLDPNFDPAKDSQYRDSIRDQRFNESYQELVNAGKLEDNQETRDWYNSYKAEWDKKNPTSEQTINPTLAALISQQAEGKKDIQTQEVPAGAPAQTQQTPSTPQPNNQTAYLEGLVKAGGGNAEWAKAQLAKMNVPVSNQPVAPGTTTPAATPATTPGTASANITPQQAAGTDWAATWNNAKINGDIDAMEEAVRARGIKLEGMDGVTDKMIADQRTMEEQTKAAREKFNTDNPTSENALESQLLENMAKTDEESKAIIKQLEDFDPIEIEEAITWEAAMEQARAQLDPKYDQARLDRLAAIDKDAAKRGFYGQMPTSKRKLTDAGMLENDRAAAVATLAQSILGMSKDDAYKKATFAASERQASLSNLLAQLQARQGLSQQNTSILSALLQSAQNKTAQKQNQANADRQFALTESELTGKYNGNPTVAYQNLLKQWEISGKEMSMAEQKFDVELALAKKQLANYGKSSGGGGSSGTKDPTQAYIAEMATALGQAEKNTQGAYGSMPPDLTAAEEADWIKRRNAYRDSEYNNLMQTINAKYGLKTGTDPNPNPYPTNTNYTKEGAQFQ